METNAKKSFFKPSEYFKPKTVEDAIKLFTTCSINSAQLVAGATDVLVEQRPGIETLIDITDIGTDYIKDEKECLRIGATTTIATLENSSKLKNAVYQVLADASHVMGTPQIRNVATIGGNICSAVPSADLVPPLLALDAKVKVDGIDGVRTISIEDFLVDVRKTALKPGEILTEIQLPHYPVGTRTVFLKMERASVADLALVNLAIRITFINDKDNVCEDVRIVLGAVAPTAIRATRAEKMLFKEKLDSKLIKKVAATAANETKPITDVRASAEYRREISRVFVERGLRSLVGLDVI